MTVRLWLALALITASLLAWSASCGDRRLHHHTADPPVTREPAGKAKPKHAMHDHAHGAHPHNPDGHHHHPHPHPHVEAADGHHHPY